MSFRAFRPATVGASRWAASIGMAICLALPSMPAAAQALNISTVTVGPVAQTGPLCAIQLSVSNPNPGDQHVPRGLVMSGTAFDKAATSGTGISQVQVFLGNRDEGGLFVGDATFGFDPTGPSTHWTLTTDIPENVAGDLPLFIYGKSALTGQEAVVQVPIVVGQEAPADIVVSKTATVACPTVQAPVSPPLALAQ